MSFVHRLMLRFAFLAMWTIWLCCLCYGLLERWRTLGVISLHLLMFGPPMVVVGLAAAWLHSRKALHPADTPQQMLGAGAILSCLFCVFVDLCLLRAHEVGGSIVLVIGFVASYVFGRRSKIKRVIVKHGDLFHQVQAIARASGVTVNKVVLVTLPQNLPNAFASQRSATILLSDRLLEVLSQRETEAVIAHEIGHLRRVQELSRSAVPLLVALAVMVRFFWPPFVNSAPFWPIATVLLWRALRRWQEFDADAHALRITRDPDAIITGLARLAHISGTPMHWGRIEGLLIGHPPMSARFQAIARSARISAARVEQLTSAANVVPPLPGFAIPVAPPPLPDSGLRADSRTRLQSRITRLSNGFPLQAVVGTLVALLILRTGFDQLPNLMLVWILVAIAAYFVCHKTISGRSK